MTTTKSTCSKCGGPLSIADGVELLKCPTCQTPYLVERSGGSVQLVRLERHVEGVEQVPDEALELERLRSERLKFQAEKSERLRWIGAAYAMGGLVIGLIPFFLGSAERSGLLAGVGFITGILGFYLGARFYLDRYYHPYERALGEFKQREEALEVQLSRRQASSSAGQK